MRKMLVTSLSGTWPEAGVQTRCGQRWEKCQISTAWEHACGGVGSQGDTVGNSSNPRAQLPMEEIWELLGRAGSGEALSCTGKWSGMDRQTAAGRDGWTELGEHSGVSAPRKAQSEQGRDGTKRGKGGVRCYKQVRAKESKKPSEKAGSISSITGHMGVLGLTVQLEGAVGDSRSNNVLHFLGK